MSWEYTGQINLYVINMKIYVVKSSLLVLFMIKEVKYLIFLKKRMKWSHINYKCGKHNFNHNFSKQSLPRIEQQSQFSILYLVYNILFNITVIQSTKLKTFYSLV